MPWQLISTFYASIVILSLCHFFIHLICHVEIVVLQRKKKQTNFSHSRVKFLLNIQKVDICKKKMKYRRRRTRYKVRNFDDISCQFLSFLVLFICPTATHTPCISRPFPSFINLSYGQIDKILKLAFDMNIKHVMRRRKGGK